MATRTEKIVDTLRTHIDNSDHEGLVTAAEALIALRSEGLVTASTHTLIEPHTALHSRGCRHRRGGGKIRGRGLARALAVTGY